MSIIFSAEMQKMIEERVKSGKYASPEDVMTAAMVTLDQQERLGEFDRGELDRLLLEGERSIQEHGTLDGDEAFRLRRERRARGGK